jgi:molybdate transport system permease protein
VGAAARPLRDRRGLGVDRQDRRSGLDRRPALGEGPGGAQERRLPPGAEAIDVGRLFRAALVVTTGVALTFLVLPVVAIFARVPPGELISALGSDAAKDALVVTARTNVISMVLILTFGTPAAYWIATRETRFRDVVVTLVELPLVLPPAVAGIGLLAAFGRLGLLGGTIDALGIDIAFTEAAVVLAVTFVASPFYVRTAVAAFEAVEPTLPAAARTLGAGPARVFARVALPLAAGGLGAGAALAFARGLGEFGATIMFAGSLQGRTQTLSLAIYEQFDLDFDVALAISAVLVVISGTVLLSVKLLTRWRSGSTSPIPFAPSTRTSS